MVQKKCPDHFICIEVVLDSYSKQRWGEQPKHSTLDHSAILTHETCVNVDKIGIKIN